MIPRRMQTSVMALAVFCLAALCSPAATAQDAAGDANGSAAAPAVVLPLAKAPPMPLRQYTLDEIAAMFPAFRHQPFETAGFNHFSLPFHYEDRAGAGDANEAQAMAFLLSGALDWGDGCYCTRHAYFVFKRCQRLMPALRKAYDPKLVSYLVTDWQASHGVGGTLIRTRDGYAGVLTIFDRAGKIVKEVKYDQPREFFQLHGDMAVDAITFLSRAPTEELAKHLHVAQCKDRQSLIDLGRAAFVEERSDEEWAIYEGILQRDPGFAAVRSWMANQRCWQDGDQERKALEMARALDSYIVLQAFGEFIANNCPDKALVAKCPQCADRVESLFGPDSVYVVRRQLNKATRDGKIPPELLAKATALAAKNANDLHFLEDLARAHYYGGGLPVDLDMAISIFVAAARNNYLTGSGNKDVVLRNIAWLAEMQGRYDLCPSLLADQTSREGCDRRAHMLLGEALYQMGRFDEAWHQFRLAFKASPTETEDGATALIDGAIAAAYAGRKDIIEQILRDRRDVLEVVKAADLVQAYLDILSGKQVDLKTLESVKTYLGERNGQRRYMVQAQYEMLQNLPKGKYQSLEINWSRYDPRNRSLMILCHELFRRDPNQAPGCFYEMLRFQRPDDPWAKQAIAEWRAWGKDPNLPDPEKLLADLGDYPPLEAPEPDPACEKPAWKLIRNYRIGEFACAIHQLVQEKKFDKARELALRYRNMVTQAKKYHMMTDASWLVNYADQARARAKAGDLPLSPDKL